MANRGDIRQVTLSNNQYTSIIKGLPNAIALDYHYEKDLLFWTDVSADVIKQSFINGTNVKDVIKWGKHTFLCLFFFKFYFNAKFQAWKVLVDYQLIGYMSLYFGLTQVQEELKYQHTMENSDQFWLLMIWINLEQLLFIQENSEFSLMDKQFRLIFKS